jgi:hypothetical protein
MPLRVNTIAAEHTGRAALTNRHSAFSALCRRSLASGLASPELPLAGSTCTRSTMKKNEKTSLSLSKKWKQSLACASKVLERDKRMSH